MDGELDLRGLRAAKSKKTEEGEGWTGGFNWGFEEESLVSLRWLLRVRHVGRLDLRCVWCLLPPPCHLYCPFFPQCREGLSLKSPFTWTPGAPEDQQSRLDLMVHPESRELVPGTPWIPPESPLSLSLKPLQFPPDGSQRLTLCGAPCTYAAVASEAFSPANMLIVGLFLLWAQAILTSKSRYESPFAPTPCYIRRA